MNRYQINHISGSGFLGSAGNTANPPTLSYPAVPFDASHFNPRCRINQWNNPYELRNCELYDLPDLNQGNEHVRTMIVNFLNNLIRLGVAGIRVDIMKHMWPHDLEVIWSRLTPLNTQFGFAPNSKPFVVGEVSDGHDRAVHGFLGSDYFPLGTITEFRYSEEISGCFAGRNQLRWLQSFGEGWGFWPSKYCLTFVDNHDNQRDDPNVLTYKHGRLYKMATAFHLAWPFGVPRVMSSFEFVDRADGPPRNVLTNELLSQEFDASGQCINGWICEHRWHQIVEMVKFRNVVKDTAVWHWWDNQGEI